jgi:hypothetical protein
MLAPLVGTQVGILQLLQRLGRELDPQRLRQRRRDPRPETLHRIARFQAFGRQDVRPLVRAFRRGVPVADEGDVGGAVGVVLEADDVEKAGGGAHKVGEADAAFVAAALVAGGDFAVGVAAAFLALGEAEGWALGGGEGKGNE